MNTFPPEKIISFWNDADFQESWREWFLGDKRKSKKCSMTDRARNRALEKIKQFAGNDKGQAIKILDRSSDNGWTDLYEIKNVSLSLMPCNQTVIQKRYPDITQQDWYKNNGI